jgi:hypothetical protein
MLESRRLLSASATETEPNNSRATADSITRDLDHEIEVTGRINTAGDRDWFEIQLKKGDVIGAVTSSGVGGLDANLRLFNAAGDVMFAEDDSNHSGSQVLPEESPLPRTHGTDLDPEIYRVITVPGTYYLELSASEFAEPGANVGTYDLNVLVARPGMENEHLGAHQILFLDFDGARVNYSDFGFPGLPMKATLSPMSSFLEGWNLSASDKNAVIDGVIARLEQLLSHEIRQNGLNGDYDATQRPGDFDIEIRNSRDDHDTWGKDPLVSRVVIGGTAAEAGFVGDLAGIFGMAETVDIGNYKASDQAVASLSWITDGIAFGVSAAAPVTQVDLVATGIAILAAHHAGFLFGCIHTDQSADDIYAGTPNIMDRYIQAFVGPDLKLGTDDDLNFHFGVDQYSGAEGVFGVNDTLNTVSFALSTGKRPLTESAGGASLVTGSGTFNATAATAASMTKDFLHTDPDSDFLADL